ncbi:hypothetical protein SESBI_16374 [Sesbania bispinosa]|nr:hypothetical protein SESBI_16374 [Sesbania bispinosa]
MGLLPTKHENSPTFVIDFCVDFRETNLQRKIEEHGLIFFLLAMVECRPHRGKMQTTQGKQTLKWLNADNTRERNLLECGNGVDTMGQGDKPRLGLEQLCG